ncbi:hypothetical protein [Streptomyces sp. NPDC050504]|uniref:hypothetical protein n=1 Tax=Streptomyces sp. NPDC050504 TaxID=3365618 RepID=UPI0037AAE6C1
MGIQVFAVLLSPRSGHVVLKSAISVVCLAAGEAVLLSGAEGMLLLNALILLASGLLFLGEIATSRENPLVALAWCVSGVVGFVGIIWYRDEMAAWADSVRLQLEVGCAVGAVLMGALAVRGERQRTAVRYDPHDLSGF